MSWFFDNPEARDKFLRAALAWKGTPFHPHAALLGVGVDCVHLIAQLYVAAGVMNSYVFPEYVCEGGHNEVSMVLGFMERRGDFERLEPATPPMSGDLLCFKAAKTVHHVAAALDHRTLIHAVRYLGVTTMSLADPALQRALRWVFRARAIADGK